MAISDTARPLAAPLLGKAQPIVDPSTGLPTPFFQGFMQQWRHLVLGANRIIPCDAAGANVITLTPLYPIAPLIDAYRAHDTFRFAAAATSSGAVTATVVPERGTLPTLKVYKDGGSNQATGGDIVSGRLYDAIYNDALDSGAGGFVLK